MISSLLLLTLDLIFAASFSVDEMTSFRQSYGKLTNWAPQLFGNLGEVVLKRPVNVVAGEQLRDCIQNRSDLYIRTAQICRAIVADGQFKKRGRPDFLVLQRKP